MKEGVSLYPCRKRGPNWSGKRLASSNKPMCVYMLCRFSRVRLCNPVVCSPPGSSVHGIL